MQSDNTMNLFVELLKVGGGIAGLLALVWRFLDEFGAYLRIGVSVSRDDLGTLARTTVDNKGGRAKVVAHALLLVGPEAESPVDTARRLAGRLAVDFPGQGGETPIEFTNDLENVRPKKPIYDGQSALIPLPFYYSENVDIADETLSYTAPIDHGRLIAGQAYSVRFYIFGEGRLHRSTEDTFFTPTPPTATGGTRSEPTSHGG